MRLLDLLARLVLRSFKWFSRAWSQYSAVLVGERGRAGGGDAGGVMQVEVGEVRLLVDEDIFGNG